MDTETQERIFVELEENVEALADELREAERVVELAEQHRNGAHTLRPRLTCPLCD